MGIKTTKLKTIAIIGDSFSADEGNDSWVTKLSTNYNVINFSQRGISEYRLYSNIIKNIEELSKADAVIIFHTNVDRIFVPDHIVFQSRQLPTHTQMDLIANDASTDKYWKKIARYYYKYFYDQSQQNCFYQLLVEKIDQLIAPQKIHCSGFDIDIEFKLISIKLFNEVRIEHPGTVNHLTAVGNQIVYNYLENIIQ